MKKTLILLSILSSSLIFSDTDLDVKEELKAIHGQWYRVEKSDSNCYTEEIVFQEEHTEDPNPFVITYGYQANINGMNSSTFGEFSNINQGRSRSSDFEYRSRSVYKTTMKKDQDKIVLYDEIKNCSMFLPIPGCPTKFRKRSQLELDFITETLTLIENDYYTGGTHKCYFVRRNN